MVHSNSSFEIILFYEKLNIPWDKWEHQNSWNMLESNPITMFGDIIKYICRLCWCFIIGVNDNQQAPPHLTIASPWAKLNLNNGSGVASMFSLLKSTHAFKQEFSFGLEQTNMTFKLIHITFNHGASQPSLGYWAIERQNDQVKHYVSSSLLNHYSRVFMSFLK